MAEKSIDRELFLFDEVAYLNPSSCEPLIRIDSEIQREGGTGGGEEISDWVMRCVKFFNKFLGVSIAISEGKPRVLSNNTSGVKRVKNFDLSCQL